MPRALLFALLALAFLGRTAAATVVVPLSDAEMFARADDVATGVVERVETVSTGAAAVETRATVHVAEVLKGWRGLDRLVLRQPGGIMGDLAIRVFGTTALAAGDTVLIFARRDRSGGHRPLATGLGIYPLALDAVGAAQAARRLFDGPSVSSEPFTFLGSPPSRWFHFDRGLDVEIRSANGDTTLGRGRSDTLLRRAFDAWSGVQTATVRLALGPDAPEGPSIAGGVCNGQSVVQFNDPADELPDLAGCSGVLAVGGFCARMMAPGPGGATFGVIVEGDVTVNRRIVDCFSENGVAEVLTHEMGHVLGLGHSSETPGEPNATLRDATMFFQAHFDGRGAAVRTDDIAGIGVLYPADDDDDRIPNELDACPGTPAGERADTMGCACVDAGHAPCGGGDVCHQASCDRDTAECVVDAVDCTGGEPCLAGDCTLAAGCSTTPVTGVGAIGCALERDFTPDACASDGVPRAVRRLVLRARSSVRRSAESSPNAAQRLLERAEVRLVRALARVDRAADLGRRRPLSADCAERLRLLIGDARVRVESRGTASLFDPVPGG